MNDVLKSLYKKDPKGEEILSLAGKAWREGNITGGELNSVVLWAADAYHPGEGAIKPLIPTIS